MNREILVHIAAPSSLRDDVRYRAQVDALLGFQPVARERIPLTSSPTLLQDSEAVCAATTTAAIQPVASGDTHHDSWDDTPVSVIPDSQPAPIAEDSNPSPNTGSNSLPAPTPNPAVARKISPAPSTEYDGPSKRRRLSSPHNDKTTADITPTAITAERQAQEAPQHATETDTSAPAPAPATKPTPAEATNVTPQLTLKTLHLPLEIKPPLPPISTTAFTTHITPTLAMLASRLKSPRTYTPLTQTRDLDVLERGHWQVRITLEDTSNQSPSEAEPERTSPTDPNTWDMAFFTRFWNFLTEFIMEQRAGWGVWCILEEDVNFHADTRPGAGAVSASASHGDTGGESFPAPEKDVSHTILRVYAWGEVALHVYLLLFLASERRIRKMGAQWRDGADEVVIQMPSHPSSASLLSSI